MQNKYETNVEPKLKLIRNWAREGLIDRDIAKKLGIAYSTFNEYKVKHSELSEALKEGKEVIDVQVENALLKRALGYSYEETMEEHSPQGAKTRVTIKQVVPDVTAQIFWLKNRKPDVWRDKTDVSIDGAVQFNQGGLKETLEELKKRD